MIVDTAPSAQDIQVVSHSDATDVGPEPLVPRFEQYEIWQRNGEKWELLGAFSDLDLAKTMARSRTAKSRLIRAVYEDDKQIEQDVIADLGATRDVA